MKLTPSILTSEIKKLVEEYEKVENLSPEQINNGYCADFFSVIFERLGCPKEIIAGNDYEPEGFGHTWIIFENRHYDAECPEGVDDWKNLPIWAR